LDASALSQLAATTSGARADDDVVEDQFWLSVLALCSECHVSCLMKNMALMQAEQFTG
jgi:hypothetical protein